MDANLNELREKIKGHILAIREDVKNAGFDASYISMASFEDETRNSAHLTTNEEEFFLYYDFEEEQI